MEVRQPRYSKEEFAQRGNEFYETQVRSQVEEGNYGKIVAIDIETGAFEVALDSLAAAKQLLKRYPNAQIFGIRIGHRAVHRFGFHSPTGAI
jgi:isochorismate synthase EntC